MINNNTNINNSNLMNIEDGVIVNNFSNINNNIK